MNSNYLECKPTSVRTKFALTNVLEIWFNYLEKESLVDQCL